MDDVKIRRTEGYIFFFLFSQQARDKRFYGYFSGARDEMGMSDRQCGLVSVPLPADCHVQRLKAQNL